MADSKKLIQIVVSGVVAVAFVQYYLKAREKNIDQSFGMVEVIAAARDIPSRTLINNPNYITIKKVPQRFIEPGALLVKDPDKAFSRVENMVTVAPVAANGIITRENLNEASPDGTGAAPVVPHGRVGYTLRLANMDVASIIIPGDRVNVLATISRGNNQSKATYTILQSILVVGVGKELIRPKETTSGKKPATEGLVLTLALTNQEAQRMRQAESDSNGEIAVVVRSVTDTGIQNIPGINSVEILDNPTPPEQLPRRQ